MDVQLNVDASAGGPASAAYEWLEHMASALAGEAMKELAGPADCTTATGEIKLTRWHGMRMSVPHNKPTTAGWDWLRAELEQELPREAYLHLGRRVPGQGLTGGQFSEAVHAFPESPGWLQLNAYVSSGDFLDPQFGRAIQRRWLDALAAFADRVNPGYGQISYHYNEGATALEDRTDYRVHGLERTESRFTIGQCRITLRGYNWLTIVPQELVPAVGGVDGLRASGAFAEVRPLAVGGVWLRATEDFADYNLAAAEPVFRTLAPILPPGKLMPAPDWASATPMVIVPADPAG
jgi:hypothetical protein